MTVVYANVLPKLLIMSVDSAITKTFNEGERTEYETGGKAYPFRGVGCVTTWGSRNGNRIGLYLNQRQINSKTHTIDDLAEIVYQYLTEEYRPHEFADEIGYHVAGFNRLQQPRLYHIFWGFDRPRRAEQIEPKYNKYDHHEMGIFLYNGRNDLVEPIIRQTIAQITVGNATRFDFNKLNDWVMFSDFIMRFAGEVTPEVGPPFITYLINAENEIKYLKNDNFCPIDKSLVGTTLGVLGF